ncbi:MAG: TPM domain-containing protein [Pseudorhodobacter sp.]|nr:TPM domain-containing protein [Rhizobacter sp.]
MVKLSRLIKHRMVDETDAKRALSPAALDRIEARVKASERHHSGEIKVCVEASLPLSYLWRDAPARERAVTMFGKLRVWDTEANNGVLIYLLLAERHIDIVADRGLNNHVLAAQWDALLKEMSGEFKRGEFESGLIAAVDAIDDLLARHFPVFGSVENRNELPDRPTVF